MILYIIGLSLLSHVEFVPTAFDSGDVTSGPITVQFIMALGADLAPLKTSEQIMNDVNKEFGLTSKANGMLFAIPTEKAFKI
ncbi:MAG: DUF1538 family protein [Clostridia bacterium]|nr:DUF1538 family protein [Clostridia bacterium]